MKKKTIFNIFTTLALSANLFTTTAGIVHADANTENVNTQNVKQEKMTWGYPFAKLNKKAFTQCITPKYLVKPIMLAHLSH